jgi:hypothetical protein
LSSAVLPGSDRRPFALYSVSDIRARKDANFKDFAGVGFTHSYKMVQGSKKVLTGVSA